MKYKVLKFYSTMFLCVISLLLLGCSKPIEEKISFNEYCNSIIESELNLKYNNVWFVNASRINDKTNYLFIDNDTILISLKLEPDYTYEINNYQIKKDSIFRYTETIPDTSLNKLNEIVNDFKKYKLISLKAYKGKTSIGFFMKNLNLNTIPVDLQKYNWTSDSTRAELLYDPDMDFSRIDGVTFLLKEDWCFVLNES